MRSLAPLRNRGRVHDGAACEPTAYALERKPAMSLVRAPSRRTWMTATPSRFAYRCLPLLIANQAGWMLLNPYRIRAIWDGSGRFNGVTIEAIDGRLPAVSSHFGSGVLTWAPPYLFRISPGYNLHIRGPANWPKDGACALEGIVETDWSPATFTVNRKLTRPDPPVVFEADEPICMLGPQRRGELEAVRPALRHLLRAPPLAASYERWSQRRAAFLSDLAYAESEAQRRDWQRDHLLGKLPNGSRALCHQTKLTLGPFVKEEDG